MAPGLRLQAFHQFDVQHVGGKGMLLVGGMMDAVRQDGDERLPFQPGGASEAGVWRD